MIFDAMNFRKVKTLGFRNAQTGDLYSKDLVLDHEGKQIDSNYTVFVKLSDCPEIKKASRLSDQQEYSIVDPKQCRKIIPITGHSLTNMSYGKSKVDHKNRFIIYHVYLVYDGEVYQHLNKNRKLYCKIFEPELYEEMMK